MINTIKLDEPFTQKEKYVIASTLTCLIASTSKGNQFIYDAFQELKVDPYEMEIVIPEIVKTEGQDGFFRIINEMNGNKKKLYNNILAKPSLMVKGKINQMQF